MVTTIINVNSQFTQFHQASSALPRNLPIGNMPDRKREIIYVPPLNFSLVEEGIYRSGHPVPINFPFLETLRLKTVIYLGDKDDNYEYYNFLKEQNLPFKYIPMESSSEPFVMNDPKAIIEALKLILNIDNYPILIHSNKGKHRVGVLVGIMRKVLQGWSMTGIYNEYDKFAGGKGESDIEFIETFETVLKCDLSKLPAFVRLDDDYKTSFG